MKNMDQKRITFFLLFSVSQLPGLASEFNFTEEIPLNEICENLKIVLKNSFRRIRYFCIQNSKNR